MNSPDLKNGNLPLHIASQNGHLPIVTWLLSAGALVNGQNNTGQTALHMARAYDYEDVALYLLAHGADGERENWEGNPAKWGIDGDRDPEDGVVMLENAKSARGVLEALEVVRGDVEGGRRKVSKKGDNNRGWRKRPREGSRVRVSLLLLCATN